MSYTNSPLVTYTNITNHRDLHRNHDIDTLTPHCIVGQWTAKQGCDYFKHTDREASANYVVGYDGSIGLSVPEESRSWATASRSNDNRAVTIEVASDTYYPYAVTDAAYNALIRLMADICRRNGIKALRWKADKSLIGNVDRQNITAHRWFVGTACPGDYLYTRMGDIANKVNALLGAAAGFEAGARKAPIAPCKVGDTVRLASGATYYGGAAIPSWVRAKQWIVKDVGGDRVVIDKSTDGSAAICSPVAAKYLIVTDPAAEVPDGRYKPNMPTVRYGSRGGAVRVAQILLNASGYSCGVVDGICGNYTLTAIKGYQSAHRLAVDGICGPATWQSMVGSYLDIVRQGSTGAHVRLAQKLLNGRGYNCGSVDGICGPNTINAISRYQRDKGLAVDGICGHQTWSSLLTA